MLYQDQNIFVMKKLNLAGLLVVGACTLQACHSPETRSVKTNDSASAGSNRTDAATGAGADQAGTGSMGGSNAGGGGAATGATGSGSTRGGRAAEEEGTKKNDPSSTKGPVNTDNTPTNVTFETKVDESESNFMKNAALGGMMEVDLGKIAQKSTNLKVKAFAEQMVTDHSKANAELKALAHKSRILLPASYTEEEKSHIDGMKKLTGASFDKHYIDMMVTDHKKTLALFKTGADSSDKGLRDFAKKTLPVITGHYEKAKAIQTELK